MGIVKQVHKADTGCSGQLSTNEPSKERTDSLHWTCVCLLYVADFGRLRVGGQSTLATFLGVFSAASAYRHHSESCIYSDVLALSNTAFFNTQANILRVSCRPDVWKEHIQRQREWLRGDQNRLIEVRTDQNYFIQHADILYGLMDTDFGM